MSAHPQPRTHNPTSSTSEGPCRRRSTLGEPFRVRRFAGQQMAYKGLVVLVGGGEWWGVWSLVGIFAPTPRRGAVGSLQECSSEEPRGDTTKGAVPPKQDAGQIVAATWGPFWPQKVACRAAHLQQVGPSSVSLSSRLADCSEITYEGHCQ